MNIRGHALMACCSCVLLAVPAWASAASILQFTDASPLVAVPGGPSRAAPELTGWALWGALERRDLDETTSLDLHGANFPTVDATKFAASVDWQSTDAVLLHIVDALARMAWSADTSAGGTMTAQSGIEMLSYFGRDVPSFVVESLSVSALADSYSSPYTMTLIALEPPATVARTAVPFNGNRLNFPEPVTLTLFGAVLVMLGVTTARWRRRHKPALISASLPQ